MECPLLEVLLYMGCPLFRDSPLYGVSSIRGSPFIWSVLYLEVSLLAYPNHRVALINFETGKQLMRTVRICIFT